MYCPITRYLNISFINQPRMGSTSFPSTKKIVNSFTSYTSSMLNYCICKFPNFK
uniref:Uncharacterized protein n=1 Tax=Rhizophagus irregularis (strain DAOM 181602 / DAOM 197198 / MUCL 43194) TaxID=747089 RepID=U9T2D2_RHIID